MSGGGCLISRKDSSDVMKNGPALPFCQVKHDALKRAETAVPKGNALL